ncbi:MAG: hypothetical protein WC030_02610 [Candidatus Paceibacterota bacterium]
MGTTDDPSLVLGVLHNLLENGSLVDGNKTRYLLGEISGLSETTELRVLKKLHDDKILKVSSYTRSNGEAYPIADDFTKSRRMNPAHRFITDPPSSAFIMTEPVSATVIFNKAKVKKKIDELNSHQPVNKEGRALQKDENGDFRFRGKPLLINNKPLEHGSLHYMVIDILYKKGNQDGKVSQAVMEKELRKQRDEMFDLPPDKIKKAVSNALLNLFRRTTIGGGKLENTLPDQRELVTTYREGRHFAGWILNNPSA